MRARGKHELSHRYRQERRCPFLRACRSTGRNTRALSGAVDGPCTAGCTCDETQPAGLEEVRGTAQKRGENLQAVPITVNAVTNAQVEAMGKILGSGNILTNASSARINGVDVEIVAVPANGLTLRSSAKYLDANYLSFPGAAFTTPIDDANGNPLGNRQRRRTASLLRLVGMRISEESGPIWPGPDSGLGVRQCWE
jgi:hypothetical protein